MTTLHLAHLTDFPSKFDIGLAPKEIAKMIRPLIGLNAPQARANVKYFEHVKSKSGERQAVEAAAKYASRQIRQRAEMIANTELAFAYNRGAHESIRQAVDAGLMSPCEKVWSTAGSHRVCSRCRELNGKVLGFDEPYFSSSVSDGQTPPLHPRCRCVIVYREVEKPKPKTRTEAEILRDHAKNVRIAEQSLSRVKEFSRKAEQANTPEEEKSYKAEAARAYSELFNARDNLHQIRIEATRRNVFLSSGLSQAYDVDDLVKIAAKVRNAPESFRFLWNLAEGDMKVLDKFNRTGAWYDSHAKGIVLDIAEDRRSINQMPYHTTFHELGHLVDHWSTSFRYFRSPHYKGELFSKTLQQEAQAYIDETFVRLKREAVLNGRPAKGVKLTDVYKAISEELKAIAPAAQHEVSDIWSGLTKNKIKGDYIHKPNYWKEDSRNLPKEAFAHMFGTTMNDPVALTNIKRYFPKSYAIFEQMIDEIVKEMT